MRIVLVLVLALSLAWGFSSCKSAEGPVLLCDTICLQDTMMFKNTSHPLQPFVYLSASNCMPDTLARGYEGLGGTRKIRFSDLVSNSLIRLNPEKVRGFVGDTSNAYLIFNDCVTGRGYSIKMAFRPGGSVGIRSGAINNLDPKFYLDENLMAYTDRGNIFIEDMNNGKEAMMTFGEIVEIDYDYIHEYIDSVNVTKDRVWARVKLAEGWKNLDKKIEFK
jgi:hypothetical protein